MTALPREKRLCEGGSETGAGVDGIVSDTEFDVG